MLTAERSFQLGRRAVAFRKQRGHLTFWRRNPPEAMAEQLKQGTEDSVSTEDGTEVDGDGSANDESDNSSANASNQEKETKPS